jgi:thioredoxin reductase (NADPH)
MANKRDILIVGGGPAGLTAAIYTARSGMDTLILEKGMPGGQLWLSEKIENYPGFPEAVDSSSFAQKFEQQAKKFGAELVSLEAESIESREHGFSVKTSSNEEIETLSVIITSGASMSKLGVRGEEELTGRGVSYCAVCDGPLFRDREVAVVGGGNTACEEALYLTRFASRVYLIHRRPRLRAVESLRDRIEQNSKIDLVLGKEIREINGKELVDSITLNDESKINVQGVFIFVGLKPNTQWAEDFLDTEKGFIVTDTGLMSSMEGVFAAGDCRMGSLRQVISACGEGAVAGEESRKYVEKKKGIAYDW